jgi:hypothetical protein
MSASANKLSSRVTTYGVTLQRRYNFGAQYDPSIPEDWRFAKATYYVDFAEVPALEES